MNIGIISAQHDDVSCTALLYLAVNGATQVLETVIKQSEILAPRRFKIIDGDHTYHFSYSFEEIKYCDVKIHISSTDALISDPYKIKSIITESENRFDKIIFAQTNGELLSPALLKIIIECIDHPKVMFICSHSVPELENHPKVIIDLNLNLFYFLNDFGFYYLNYYPYKDKSHLIGIYNRYDEYKSARHKIKQFLEEQIGCEIHKFQTGSPFFSDVSGSILGKWAWQQMHITSYTDYMTAVANIVFESAMGYNKYFSFTEKTLKSIIFQEADIFFIYFGTTEGLEYLHKRGFWFLNSEFFDKDNLDNDIQFPEELLGGDQSLPIYRSVYKSVEYLNKLKTELGTDNAVYEFLLSTYGDKLRSNTKAFKHLMSNCEYRDKLLNFITDK
jgi:hypothetical protein